MGSSLGFVSNPCDLHPTRGWTNALFRLAFATAPGVTPLAWPQRLTRRLILQKARRQAERRASGFHRRTDPPSALRLLVGLRFQVLFHSPHRGTFHLSLTVLVHYRSPNVFSLGEWSPQLPTGLACPVVLRFPTGAGWLSPTGLLPSLVGFPIPFR
jgi:hypothetical protein